ncbi:hypothetical protein [Halomonas sp. WWR20]
MLDVLIFITIYIGVTISIYQIYDIYYKLDSRDDEEMSSAENGSFQSLSLKANEYARTGASPGFMQAVKNVFGCDLDHRIVLAAFAGEKPQINAAPLLRRKNNIVCNGKIRILHLPFWKTNPPTKDIRGVLLPVVIINSLLVLFLAGLSVYTQSYEVTVDYLWWFNSEFTLMVLIYTLILITHFLSKFGLYMHDIYQIGKLNGSFCADHGGR